MIRCLSWILNFISFDIIFHFSILTNKYWNNWNITIEMLWIGLFVNIVLLSRCHICKNTLGLFGKREAWMFWKIPCLHEKSGHILPSTGVTKEHRLPYPDLLEGHFPSVKNTTVNVFKTFFWYFRDHIYYHYIIILNSVLPSHHGGWLHSHEGTL